MEKGKWVKSNCEKEESTSVECRMLKNKNGEKGIPKREKMDKNAFFFFLEYSMKLSKKRMKSMKKIKKENITL